MSRELVERLRKVDAEGFRDAPTGEEIDALLDRIEYLERRLEVVPEWGEDCDGIGCRDETIKLLDERIERLSAESADLKQAVIAFAAPWAVQYAKDFDLPAGSLHPEHYDLLAKCGARMDSFTRADVG